LAKTHQHLRAFSSAHREPSHRLDQVQHGKEREDWKAMTAVGPGVREIRIRDAPGGLRILCVATFADAVYMPHFFQKKNSHPPRVHRPKSDLRNQLFPYS
jgi:phage-related protein